MGYLGGSLFGEQEGEGEEEQQGGDGEEQLQTGSLSWLLVFYKCIYCSK